MAVLLTTSFKELGWIYTANHGAEHDRSFQILAKYTKLTATTARITVRVYFASNASIWGGSGNVYINGTNYGGFSFSSWSTSDKTFDVTYDTTTGKFENKGITVELRNVGGARWGDNEVFDATPQNNVSTTYSLPAIDPTPSVSISSITTVSGAFNGLRIAGYTKVRVACTFNYMKSATLQMIVNGVTTNLATFTDSKTQGCVKTHDVILPGNEALDGSTFAIQFKITASNDTGSASASQNITAYKYQKPTYNASLTIKYRSDINGNQMNQGLYGYLKLYWNVSRISGNALQSGAVKINGTTLTAENCERYSQNIANGYFEYVFPLPINVQGNITVELTDGISNNSQTSMMIPQAVVPLGLYQAGSSVGVAVGRMATEEGLRVYTGFYLLGDDGYTMYKVHIDSSGNIAVTAV